MIHGIITKNYPDLLSDYYYYLLGCYWFQKHLAKAMHYSINSKEQRKIHYDNCYMSQRNKWEGLHDLNCNVYWQVNYDESAQLKEFYRKLLFEIPLWLIICAILIFT